MAARCGKFGQQEETLSTHDDGNAMRQHAARKAALHGCATEAEGLPIRVCLLHGSDRPMLRNAPHQHYR